MQSSTAAKAASTRHAAGTCAGSACSWFLRRPCWALPNRRGHRCPVSPSSASPNPCSTVPFPLNVAQEIAWVLSPERIYEPSAVSPGDAGAFWHSLTNRRLPAPNTASGPCGVGITLGEEAEGAGGARRVPPFLILPATRGKLRQGRGKLRTAAHLETTPRPELQSLNCPKLAAGPKLPPWEVLAWAMLWSPPGSPPHVPHQSCKGRAGTWATCAVPLGTKDVKWGRRGCLGEAYPCPHPGDTASHHHEGWPCSTGTSALLSRGPQPAPSMF